MGTLVNRRLIDELRSIDLRDGRLLSEFGCTEGASSNQAKIESAFDSGETFLIWDGLYRHDTRLVLVSYRIAV